MISKYISAQIEEVTQSALLRFFGAVLAFTLVLTNIFWISSETGIFLAKDSEALCWPQFWGCRDFRFLSRESWDLVFAAFAVVSSGLVIAFLKERSLRWSWCLLLLLSAVKVSIILLDYRLRLNQHIMSTWVTLAFLFIPNKAQGIRLLLQLFYFAAGLVKLNTDWLSGAALQGRLPFFEGVALRWACAYVVVLELFLVWGLLSRKPWFRWSTWGQLLLFHALSFPVVGFFYPTLMFSLLLIYPLSWFLETSKPSFSWQKYRAPLAFGLVFALTQTSWMAKGEDPALTGKGRLLSLHMIDAWVDCEATAQVHDLGKPLFQKSLLMSLPARIKCDPVVFKNRAENLCKKFHLKSTNLDLHLKSKRSTATNYTEILNIKNFCRGGKI